MAVTTRRSAIKQIAAAAAAGSAVATLDARVAEALEQPEAAVPVPHEAAEQEEAAPAPWALIAPLEAGSTIGAWTLLDMLPVQHGATVLVLEGPKREIGRVHLCARGERPRGLAHTTHFDLVLMNGGDGGTPSQESLARVLAVVASRVELNSEAALREHPELAQLMPHQARVEAYSGTACEILA